MKDWKGNKASVFKTIGAASADHDRQREDYYATEPAATEWLCRLEQFGTDVWEPACGEGHMSRVLEQHGYRVRSTDIVDRGYGERFDFLGIDNQQWAGDIITNPPYRYAQEFVERALLIIPDGRKVAMFLKLTFLEGKSRRELFRNTPPYGLGQQQPPEVRHERRLRLPRRLGHGLCLVRVDEGLPRRHHHPLV